MHLFLTLLVVMGADGGTVAPAFRLDRFFEEYSRLQNVLHREDRVRLIQSLTVGADALTGGERQLAVRLKQLIQQDEFSDKQVIEFSKIVRDFTKLARGRLTEELAAGSLMLSLAPLAKNVGLDPEPARREAVAFASDLASRYPAEGRAHGVLASASIAANADSEIILTELKRCSELDKKSWCADTYARALSDRNRPMCRGTMLTKSLTAIGAEEESAHQVGPTIVYNEQKYTLEAKPFLSSEDFASIAVDPDGNLVLEVNAAAKKRLEQETKRLLRKTVVLRFGEEILLAASLMEPIANGQIFVRRGNSQPPFSLDALCGPKR
jgi:hypothetical protein